MSASILSICPNCEAKLKFKDPNFLGKKARCPSCSEPFVVKQSGISTVDLAVMSDTQQLPGHKSPSQKPLARRTNKSPTAPDQKTAQPIGQGRPRPASALSQEKPRKPIAKRQPPHKAPASLPEDDWLSDDLDTYESREIPKPPPRSVGRQATASPPKKKRKKKNPYAQQQSTAVSIVFALMGGSVAAVIGAVAWIGIVIATGYELGILAWGIGGLVGFGVLLSSRDHIVGDLSGLLAAVIALLSITLPKLLLYLLARVVDGGGQLGLGDLFSPFDLLWGFLATTTAYKVGSGQAGED